MLTQEQIDEFKTYGVLVIENILDLDEIEYCRNKFHQELNIVGINHDRILSGLDDAPADARIKSPVSQMFYGKWKIKAMLKSNIYESIKQLMIATFGSGKEYGFEHPIG